MAATSRRLGKVVQVELGVPIRRKGCPPRRLMAMRLDQLERRLRAMPRALARLPCRAPLQRSKLFRLDRSLRLHRGVLREPKDAHVRRAVAAIAPARRSPASRGQRRQPCWPARWPRRPRILSPAPGSPWIRLDRSQHVDRIQDAVPDQLGGLHEIGVDVEHAQSQMGRYGRSRNLPITAVLQAFASPGISRACRWSATPPSRRHLHRLMAGRATRSRRSTGNREKTGIQSLHGELEALHEQGRVLAGLSTRPACRFGARTASRPMRASRFGHLYSLPSDPPGRMSDEPHAAPGGAPKPEA